MKSMMILQKVGAPMEREFPTQQGEVKKIPFRMIRMTDGIDSIYGETTERLTNRINSTNDDIRIKLIEGHVYSVEYTLQTVDYKDKDGHENIFFKCSISKLSPIL